MPRASKPGPRLALEPGTRNVLTEFNLSLCTTLCDVHRYLCSDLVVLRTNDEKSVVNIVVNLEEIWASGAVIDSEKPVGTGSKLEIQAGDARFQGMAKSVEHHEFGWRVEMEFSPLTPWSPGLFTPKHLLELPEPD